jgi:mRNA interferase HigB
MLKSSLRRGRPVLLTKCSRLESIILVRVLSRKALREFADFHPDAETPLDDWYRTTKRLTWTSLVDVRRTYPHADAVGEFTIFNIGGNKFRLATFINYRTGRVYIRQVMTHTQYSKEDWKKR